jgi:hypothetical protein
MQKSVATGKNAEESSEAISAAGAENTQSFSGAEFHELSRKQFQVLISLDYPPRRQEARLSPYPCVGTEIPQPPSCRRRLNFGSNEACATATSEPLLIQIAGWVAEEHARVKVAIDAAFEKLRQAGLRTSVVVRKIVSHPWMAGTPRL